MRRAASTARVDSGEAKWEQLEQEQYAACRINSTRSTNRRRQNGLAVAGTICDVPHRQHESGSNELRASIPLQEHYATCRINSTRGNDRVNATGASMETTCGVPHRQHERSITPKSPRYSGGTIRGVPHQQHEYAGSQIVYLPCYFGE